MNHHLTDTILESRLFDIESDIVERKATISDPKDIRQAICAFANDLPGHNEPGIIFIGVHNDGSCANLIIDDRLLLTLSHMKDDGNIVPFPSINVEKRNLRGCGLAVVIVLPSRAPPVRFRGRVYIRVGPRRGIATPEEERRLSERRRSRDLPFDLQSVPSATLRDLDLDLFNREYLPQATDPEILRQNTRTSEDQLKSLRFIDSEGVPTVLGLLVLGTDPRRFIPCAYIQFIRFDGTELTDPIRDQSEIDGPLPEMLRKLDEKMSAHNSIAISVYEQPTEVRYPEYPIIALQQIIRNAVLHRSYDGTNAPIRLYWFSDRIEIQNPGGPYGQVSIENFGILGITDYRNPHIAEAMKVLGYVQRFGVGIQISRQQLQKNNNPPLELNPYPENILAIIRRRQ